MTSLLLSTTLNETRKGLITLWDYKFNLLIQLLGFLMIVVGIMFFVGQGDITEAQVKSTLLGFIITFYAMETISMMSWSLMQEAQVGTLEQMYMSPAPTQLIVLGRSLASLVSTTLQLILVMIIAMLIFGVAIPIPPESFVVLGITMIGLLGFAYIIGGLTLIFKQVGPLANIVQNLLIIVNGTFLPVQMMPEWMANLVVLFPSTLGIILMRRVSLDGATLDQLVMDGSLLWLVVHSIVFLIIGMGVYTLCEKQARKMGSLGQY